MERSEGGKRIDELAGRSDRFEAEVKQRFDKVDQKFDKVDQKFERFEDKVDARFDKQDHKLDTINRTVWVGIVAAAAVNFLFG
jgi:thymidylate kinase